MPLNKSTTYHQSVQFFVQFFFKKNCLFTETYLFLTQFYLKSTQFYHNLLSFTSSGTQFYQIPCFLCLVHTALAQHRLPCPPDIRIQQRAVYDPRSCILSNQYHQNITIAYDVFFQVFVTHMLLFAHTKLWDRRSSRPH